MTKRFRLHSAAVALFIGAATSLVSAAPSVEELLSTAPVSIIESFPNNPDYNLTPWQVREFSTEENELKILFKAEVSLNSLPQEFKNFLLTEDFFVSTPGNNYRPTPYLIEFTKPADLPGGVWSFGYESFDSSLRAGDAYHVISWTWKESETIPTSVLPGNLGQSLANSLTLNRAVERTIQGKNPRKALPLLKRQRNFLSSALTASN